MTEEREKEKREGKTKRGSAIDFKMQHASNSLVANSIVAISIAQSIINNNQQQ
jgi:hypothetical protein